MDPRAWRDPVGPLPARVYWRRRLVPLLVVLVVVVVAARGCAGGGGEGGGQAVTATTRPTPLPTSPRPSPTQSTAPPCRPGDLRVVASTDATSYPAGVEPRMTVTITTRAGACRLDDAATRTWTIRSGTDRVWTTADCASPTPTSSVKPHRVRVTPHHAVTHTLVWARHRSTAGCGQGAPAQPGTYRLYVTVDGVTSPAAIFHLTQ